MKLSEKVRIDESPIDGRGLFAKVPFKAGDFIGTYEGYTPRRDSKFVLYCWNGSSRRGTNELRFTNHSDTNNATVNGYRFYALTDIELSDEITINYGPQDGWTLKNGRWVELTR